MIFPQHISTAIDAAILACEEIMKIYRLDFDVFIKKDESPLTQADLKSSEAINDLLVSTKIPIISEEILNLPYQERQNWKHCWIVDPLDGTKEFIKKNDEFAVCIALVENNQPIWGIIASPVQQKLWVGSKKTGLFELNFKKSEKKICQIQTPFSKIVTPKVLVSRSHLSEETKQYLKTLQNEYKDIIEVSKGSALKFVDLALGVADIYPRFGPTMEWDVAAGHAIVEAAGGRLFETNGRELIYNKELLKNPYFIAQRL